MNVKQDLQFKLLVATLGVWLILGSLVIGWVDSTFYMLAFGLLALTTTLTLIYSSRLLDVGIVIAGTLIFGVVQVLVYGFTPRIVFPAIVCLVALSGAAALGTLANRQFTRVSQQLEQQHRLVDELRVYDPDTNLLRYPYALQTLKNEIARSQRYNRPLCVLFLRVNEPPEWMQPQGELAKRAAYQQIAELVRGSLRTVDVAFFNATKFGAILPETDAVGSRLVAERLIERIANKMRLATYIGIAHFPSDGVTEEELVRGAEAALQLALTTGQPLVFYVQLRHAVRPAAPIQPLDLPPTSQPSPLNHTGIELHIAGLRDLANTLRIEQALRDYVGAENVRTLRFMDGTLVLELKHPPSDLTQKLAELIPLPIEQLAREGRTIHARVQEASVGTAAH
ncbi:MAG: diguanylate cyclase [Anaerolineae bacterium]|nr:diguanylate cyclase [Anaerolineae bacterium]